MKKLILASSIFLSTIAFSLTENELIQLKGNMDSNLNIRQDIYDFIYNNVPRNTPHAFRSAIVIAQEEYKINFVDQTIEEYQKSEDRIIIAKNCIDLDNIKYAYGYHVFNKIQMLMRNSRERFIHVFEVSDKISSLIRQHKITLKDLSDEEIRIACSNPEFTQ